jgi:site-specific recombinase XerC
MHRQFTAEGATVTVTRDERDVLHREVHSYATRLINASVPVHAVQRALRHELRALGVA